MKHTPKQWGYSNWKDCFAVWADPSKNRPPPICDGRVTICKTFDNEERGVSAEANAKLIAASPELLDALQSLLDMYVELGYSGDAGYFDPEKQDEVIKARAAIAKATGV